MGAYISDVTGPFMQSLIFFHQESSTLVAIYDEPLGQETDKMTLIFPGDVPGSSPQRVVPKRVGTRTLVFSTPGELGFSGNAYSHSAADNDLQFLSNFPH